MLIVEMMPISSVPDEKIAFAVIMARTACGWLFVRHKARQTWEIPGGHREAGETPSQTAVRELYEETGAEVQCLEPITAYSVDTGMKKTYGALYFAETGAMKELPDSEIAEVISADAMPEELTYPEIQPVLFEAGYNFAQVWDCAMSDVF